MNDVLEQLAKFRERQGLEPIDGSRIQGEPGPPPPPLSEELLGPEPPDFPMDEDDLEPPDYSARAVGASKFQTPPSPLIPRLPAPEPVQENPAIEAARWLGSASLTVRDGSALYKGRAVELTEGEVSQVTRVVLRAIRRSVQVQLAEIDAQLPKRKRGASSQRATKIAGHSREVDGASPGESGPPPAPPKRRGRPPKQRLDGVVR